MKKFKDHWVQQFVDDALPKLKTALNPGLVLLFGSRSKGEGTDESDLDILIVSDYFNGKPFLGRMPYLLKMLRFQRPIDFLCYSPDEFNKIRDNSIVVRQAIKEGIKL